MSVNEKALLRVIGSASRPPEQEIRCGGCRRRPAAIGSVLLQVQELHENSQARPPQGVGAHEWLNQIADRQVREGDGTYNPQTRRFLCDECYIRAEMPTGETAAGWQCP